MTLEDVCAYNLDDGDFDELFRDVEIKNSSDTVICAVEPPTTQEIVLDAQAMKGSEREAQGEAGATSQASSFTKIYHYAGNISDYLSSKMADAYLL